MLGAILGAMVSMLGAILAALLGAWRLLWSCAVEYGSWLLWAESGGEMPESRFSSQSGTGNKRRVDRRFREAGDVGVLGSLVSTIEGGVVLTMIGGGGDARYVEVADIPVTLSWTSSCPCSTFKRW